jgi:hypothetical protein
MTIRSSWARTGLGYQAKDRTTYLVVDEDRVRAADGFREIRQFDFHPNQLNQSGAAQKSGWTNEYLLWKKERVMGQH